MELTKGTALAPELLAQIRGLHFFVKRLAEEGLSGQYRSAFRGRGIEFEEVRPYAVGDDIRSIDWKVTARRHEPFVKSYREERELSVMVALDVSASTGTGTRSQSRDVLIAKLGAILTLIALKNNDKVGLLTFSDKLESYHPPRKARSCVWRILHEALDPTVHGRTTDLAGTLSFMSRVLSRRTIVFVVSDFITPPFERELAVLSKRHDVIAVMVRDPADELLPAAGLVELVDPESGRSAIIDSSDPGVQKTYNDGVRDHRCKLERTFRKYGVDCLLLHTDRPFTNVLRRFFEQRSNTSSHLRQPYLKVS